MNRRSVTRRALASRWSRALAEAAEWRLMALLLERPRVGWHEEVMALGREVGASALRAAAEAAHGATEGEYLHLVGPGGLVSPREVAYRSFEDPGQILADVASAYRAFAFRPRTEDPPDHIAVLTDFAGYLLLKEAFARANGNRTAAETTAVARRNFLVAHLTPMAAPFADRLAVHEAAYLDAAARQLVARVPAARETSVRNDRTSSSLCVLCPPS
jgi:TorA maturation chaperone TorD